MSILLSNHTLFDNVYFHQIVKIKFSQPEEYVTSKLNLKQGT